MMFRAYDNLALPLYAVGLDSYEVLYINDEGKKLLGDITGSKCHQSLNGTGTICDGCVSGDCLSEQRHCHVKSRYLAAVDKHIDTHESITTLPDGTRCRLCVIVDVTEQVRMSQRNEAKEQARRDMQHLIDIQSGFIGSAKSMMSAATMSGEMIFANQTMSDTLGFTQEEILGMSVRDFHPPEVQNAYAEEYIPKALAEGSWKGDSVILKKDGSCLPVRQIVFPIKNKAGENVATATIMDDITQVLEQERMNRYQFAIMDSTANYIGVSDLEGNTMYHSPGAYRMLGYEPGETGEWDKRASHPDWYLKRVLEEGIPTAMREGQWTGRGEVIDRHGKHIPIEQTIFPVFDEHHQPMGNATIISDITETVKQEREIEAARLMLRTIIDTSPSAIFWKDRSSRYLGANKRFAIDSGVFDQDKLIGMTDYDFLDKETADFYVSIDRRIFETGEEQFHLEEQAIDPDGTVRWISTSKVLIRDDHGEPYALLGVYDDITTLKENEIKLEQAILAAEEAGRAKGDFLSRMSHEIRTPMNSIKGFAELLALTELSSVQDSYVKNIVKSSNSLLSIINDVLDFSKINENKIELVNGVYQLTDLIAEVSNVVSLRAIEKGLMLLMEVSPSLPKSLIGDDVRVKQVIINILNNAVKYTQKGHVIMHLYGEETADGFELVCAVEDTGIGIHAEDIPFLFEAFSQADRKVNHNIQGTGLGLAISERLINSMGGNITVESEYGKGSIFTARFPQRVEHYEPLAAVSKPEEKRVLLLERDVRIQCAVHMLDELGVAYAAASCADSLAGITLDGFTHCVYDDSFGEDYIRNARQQLPSCVFVALKDMRYAMGHSDLHDTVLFIPLLITELAKALELVPGQSGQESSSIKTIDNFALVDTQVLVVDDNEINLIVSGEILRAYKAEVTYADSGQAALDICAEMQFDLIFMDHMMPGMDGIETTIAIRGGDTINKKTPIVALTANVVNDMASHYLQNGMDDFISKPIEIEDLRRVLLKWISPDKITSMSLALQPETAPPDEAQELTMGKLICSLDAFGMYVSEVMREINNDSEVFISRMERIRTELSPLVKRLREEVADEDWDVFAADISDLGAMIHDVGARDCSGRARKLSLAARERNLEHIREDFYPLMDNMFMLEKKMEVAIPLAQGSLSPDVPFGDIHYCYARLVDLRDALSKRDVDESSALLDALAHYSLDHTLDIMLVDVSAKLRERDYAAAYSKNEQALSYCAALL